MGSNRRMGNTALWPLAHRGGQLFARTEHFSWTAGAAAINPGQCLGES
jgi:hypothetical protein